MTHVAAVVDLDPRAEKIARLDITVIARSGRGQIPAASLSLALHTAFLRAP